MREGPLPASPLGGRSAAMTGCAVDIHLDAHRRGRRSQIWASRMFSGSFASSSAVRSRQLRAPLWVKLSRSTAAPGARLCQAGQAERAAVPSTNASERTPPAAR